MDEIVYLSPQQLDEACLLLESGGTPVAGCTDVLPQMRRGRLQTSRLIDLSRIRGLDGIEQLDSTLRLGALVTYEDLLASPLVRSAAPSLAQAAATVGCRQTRNRGTVGGNLGNASPAGDTLPPLLVMNASLVLQSSRGERRLPISSFLLGPGKNALWSGEIIRQVECEAQPDDAQSCFIKLGNRNGMAVSVVSVAVLVSKTGDRTIREARIALGAVAPTAMRCPEAEAFLNGKSLDEQAARDAAALAAQACTPIDDVRATAAYRRHAVRVLVKRALLSC